MFLSVTVIIQRLYVIEQLISNTRAEHAPTGKPTGGELPVVSLEKQVFFLLNMRLGGI